MSIFGNNNQQPSGGSLFGGGSNNTSSGQTTGASLFSNPTNPSTASTSLFGNNTSNTQNTNTGGGLFGSSTPQDQNQNQQTGSSLFGGNKPTTSLFGNTTNQTQQNNTGSSLFGGGNNQQQNTQPAGQSLFGGTNNAPPPGPSLFGGATNNQQQSSIFQPSATQPSGAASTFSGFNPMISGSQFPPGLTLDQQQEFARTRLNQAGLSATVNERSPFEQAKTLLAKWDPNSQSTLLQAYLYNAVSSAYAPFYYKNPDEDEASWEKALAEAPRLPEDSGQKFVPTLVRGFYALGQRVEYQAKFVAAMQVRLHEMNNSLTAVMEAHQQRITVSIENSRRKHAALSQRILRLAVKSQVLRNRGYALDSQEEILRRQLLELEQKVFDPAFSGREEEIWARMVTLRERARWLEEEGKRLGQQVRDQGQTDGEGGSGVPEEVVQKTKKILKDYGAQLRQLSSELEDVQKEYRIWEEGQQAAARR